jgi:hypothetical protein
LGGLATHAGSPPWRSGYWIPATPDEIVALAKINITYHRDPGASEMMTLSDGASDAILYLSPLGGMSMLLRT